MATTADVQRFADEHRAQLTYGPGFRRGVRDAIARAWHAAQIGHEDGADYFLDAARQAAAGPCPKRIWVPIPGTDRSEEAPCPRRGTVAVQWGMRPVVVCEPCAAELCDGSFIQACRLPDGAEIVPLEGRDRHLIKAICARIAGRGGVDFAESPRGVTATIRHWGRQSSALAALRARGFQALQPSDNPTVRVVGRAGQPTPA
jgi:hypothetical protein